MAAGKSMSLRGVGITIMLVMAGLFVSIYHQTLFSVIATQSHLSTISRGICAYDYNELHAMVWSHRGHYSRFVDSSREAMEWLLGSGVVNFDVDVSCRRSQTGSCEYVIAHPSVLENKENSKMIQTVPEFLQQIYNFCDTSPVCSLRANSTVRPLVTLEMKFTERNEQVEFVKLVQQSKFADNVAIIGADPETLAGVIDQIHRGGVAAAYRSIPLSNHDYNWPKPSTLGLHHQLVQSKQESKDTATENLKEDKDNPINLVSQRVRQITRLFPLLAPSDGHSNSINVSNVTQTIYFPVSEVNSNADTLQNLGSGKLFSRMLQIYMPDAKLVRNQIVHMLGRFDHSSVTGETAATSLIRRRTIMVNHPVKVVAWVVDDVATMWDLLMLKGVDAVISNHPVELLQALRNAHKSQCVL